MIIEVESKAKLHEHLANRLANSEIIAKTAEAVFKDKMDCPIGSNLCVVYTAQKMIRTMRHAAFDFYAQLIDEGQKPLADKILREIRGVCQKVG